MTDSTPPGDGPPPPPEGTVPPPPPPPGTPPPSEPPPGSPPDELGTGSTPPEGYPVDLEIEYQDRELNRLTTAFRLIVAIPILIIVGLLAGGGSGYGDRGPMFVGGGAALIVVPTALMIIFREKYPRWWFDFNFQLQSFLNRVAVFMLLIDDRYPATDDSQGVQLKMNYPNVEAELNRYAPIYKWFLAIPHYIVLFFIGFGVLAATIYAWFVILFTGRYPHDVYEIVSGYLRWCNRVNAYAFLMVTDEYPPFRFSS